MPDGSQPKMQKNFLDRSGCVHGGGVGCLWWMCVCCEAAQMFALLSGWGSTSEIQPNLPSGDPSLSSPSEPLQWQNGHCLPKDSYPGASASSVSVGLFRGKWGSAQVYGFPLLVHRVSKWCAFILGSAKVLGNEVYLLLMFANQTLVLKGAHTFIYVWCFIYESVTWGWEHGRGRKENIRPELSDALLLLQWYIRTWELGHQVIGVSLPCTWMSPHRHHCWPVKGYRREFLPGNTLSANSMCVCAPRKWGSRCMCVMNIYRWKLLGVPCVSLYHCVNYCVMVLFKFSILDHIFLTM